MPANEGGSVAAHFAAWLPEILKVAKGGLVLDLASGRGRHARAIAEAGFSVVALDRNPDSLRELASETSDVVSRGEGRGRAARVACLRADLEGEVLPPLRSGTFAAILVFRYLHRPLMPWIEQALVPGGLLLYETFTKDQRELGWGPRRDAFLLEAGELPALFPGLDVESYVEGLSEDAQPAQTGRLVARRPR